MGIKHFWASIKRGGGESALVVESEVINYFQNTELICFPLAILGNRRLFGSYPLYRAKKLSEVLQVQK